MRHFCLFSKHYVADFWAIFHSNWIENLTGAQNTLTWKIVTFPSKLKLKSRRRQLIHCNLDAPKSDSICNVDIHLCWSINHVLQPKLPIRRHLKNDIKKASKYFDGLHAFDVISTMGSGQDMTVTYYRSTANGRMSTGAHECHLPRELIRKGFLAIDDSMNRCILNTFSVRQSTLTRSIQKSEKDS